MHALRHPTHYACPPQVFYNNLLSLPFILVLMAGSGELSSVWREPDLSNSRFQARVRGAAARQFLP